MNVPGGHDAARRVPPAQQCFGAACPAAHDIDPRLIVQLELAARERLVQLALEAPPLLREAAHSRADALECPAPALSDAVHGPLGVPYERIGCVAGARIQADADARGDEHFERIQPQWPADRLNALGGDDPGLFPVADMARESEEFITARARDRVPRAHRDAQPLRHRHLVPAQPPLCIRSRPPQCRFLQHLAPQRRPNASKLLRPCAAATQASLVVRRPIAHSAGSLGHAPARH